MITRVRRGDADLVATPETVLELGDRARVVAPSRSIADVSRYLGDSYKALGEVDVATFGLGIAIGLALGAVPFPLPGGGRLLLGIAGGPLAAGLVLGALRRTGPLLWQLPHSTGVTLRQLGVTLFFAGVGLRSGAAFAEMLGAAAVPVLAAGTAVTVAAAAATVWVGSRVLRLQVPALLGVLAALQTQPALLTFAEEGTDSDEPAVGYATVFPAAMITKLVLGQALVAVLVSS